MSHRIRTRAGLSACPEETRLLRVGSGGLLGEGDDPEISTLQNDQHLATLCCGISWGLTLKNQQKPAVDPFGNRLNWVVEPDDGTPPQTPPPNREGLSNKSGQQTGGPLSAGFQHGFQQNSFPVTWISVSGPKHTFLLVVAQ